MNIEDCKIGTRVRCLKDEAELIPFGALGTIIEDYKTCVYVSWDSVWSERSYTVGNYSNVTGMYLGELEKIPEVPTPEKEIAKLTVSVSLEDKEEIAKDILKIVLKDLNVIISDAIDSLSNDNEEFKQPVEVPTVASNVDFSDEKLQSMFEEVMKEYLRDSINTLNKTAFGI